MMEPVKVVGCYNLKASRGHPLVPALESANFDSDKDAFGFRKG